MSHVRVELLALENVGPFRGYHEFILSEDEHAMAVVVTGRSGAGKTYFLRTLCWLFGVNQKRIGFPLTTKDVNFDAHQLGINNFSARSCFDVGGNLYERFGATGDMFAPIRNVDGLLLIDQHFLGAYEKAFITGGGHGVGDLIVFTIHAVLNSLSDNGRTPVILLDEVIERLDKRQSRVVSDALAAYRGQAMIFGHLNTELIELAIGKQKNVTVVNLG